MLTKSTFALALSSMLLPAFVRCEDKLAETKAEPKKEMVEISKSPADEKQLIGIETWIWTGQGSTNGVDVKHAAIKEQPTNNVLVVDYLGGRTEKATVKCVTELALDPQGKLNALVFCNEKDLPKVAFAVSTGDSFIWQESEPVALKEGWNEFEAKLGDKKWKSEATKWKHEAEAKGLDDVRAILLLVFNGKHGGILYVDALHADRDPKLEQELKELTKKLGAEDFEAREGAGKRLAEIGRKALPYLREAADGNDPEVAQRAKKVVEQIEGKLHADVKNEANTTKEAKLRVRQKVEMKAERKAAVPEKKDAPAEKPGPNEASKTEAKADKTAEPKEEKIEQKQNKDEE